VEIIKVKEEGAIVKIKDTRKESGKRGIKNERQKKT
jgi:hypothetical protein